MKSSSYYKALPESMPVEDIKVEFLDVLKCLKSVAKRGQIYFSYSNLSQREGYFIQA